MSMQFSLFLLLYYTTDGRTQEQPTWALPLNDVVLIIKTGVGVALKRLYPILVSGNSLAQFRNVLIVSDGLDLWPNSTYRVFDAVENGSRVQRAQAAIGSSLHVNEHFLRELALRTRKRAFARHNAGWKTDRLKNIPAFAEALQIFPDAKWFFMIDDDTYLSARNFATFIDTMSDDISNGIYLGNIMGGGCKHPKYKTWQFAHGGSGILLSRNAIVRMSAILDFCIAKCAQCWAGDIQLALCLLYLEPPIYARSMRGLHAESPSKTLSKSSGVWCQPPITFHHLSVEEFRRMSTIEAMEWKTKNKFLLDGVAQEFFLHPLLTKATLQMHDGDIQCIPAMTNAGDVLNIFSVQHDSLSVTIDAENPTAGSVMCAAKCKSTAACAAFRVLSDNSTCILQRNIAEQLTSFGSKSDLFCILKSRFQKRFQC